MDTTTLKMLYEQAAALGMCDDFKQHWDKYGDNITIEQLCNMYHRGLDFCIEHGYPSVEFMAEHLRGRVEPYGVYIHDRMVAYDTRNVVINGDSEIRVVANGVVRDITVRHSSTVIVEAYGDAFVYVSMYNNSRLVIRHKDESARICVSYYGGTIDDPEMVDKVYEKKRG